MGDVKILTCKVPGCDGTVWIDSDSYEVNIEGFNNNGGVEMSASVKGYCRECQAEHTFSIQGDADIVVK